MRRDPWQALADPTRREIISALTERSHTVNEVASLFEVSRPAISKQIKILQECGLVEITKIGRSRNCVLIPEPLEEIYEWVSHYEKFWLENLDRLDNYLNKQK